MKILVPVKLLEFLRDGNFWEAAAEKAACVIACLHVPAGLVLFSVILITRSRIGFVPTEARGPSSGSRHNVDFPLA